ncbi:small acid-soluble spore protein I (minor) [Seinonella peptonophila]|uniref:Small, acid-soluble spore protein I n=1 Tax=Seinonella peptonophila TaxID=112248 RepID=A0A1M4U654_9BACL|nr:small acid-soluble spore protein SspI [Seinonella peptonophila]SHE52165.1 small acid-soluble spore protein I (minor) [Seinonella peptonophila]
MNFNIRGAVLHNVKEMEETEIVSMIQESIQNGEEKFLPGLGVLFEVIWNHSDQHARDTMIHTLHDQLEQSNPSPFIG